MFDEAIAIEEYHEAVGGSRQVRRKVAEDLALLIIQFSDELGRLDERRYNAIFPLAATMVDTLDDEDIVFLGEMLGSDIPDFVTWLEYDNEARIEARYGCP